MTVVLKAWLISRAAQASGTVHSAVQWRTGSPALLSSHASWVVSSLHSAKCFGMKKYHFTKVLPLAHPLCLVCCGVSSSRLSLLLTRDMAMA